MLLIPPRELAQFAVESVESARNIAAASTVTSNVIDPGRPTLPYGFSLGYRLLQPPSSPETAASTRAVYVPGLS